MFPTKGFLMFSKGIKRENWEEKGYHRISKQLHAI